MLLLCIIDYMLQWKFKTFSVLKYLKGSRGETEKKWMSV